MSYAAAWGTRAYGGGAPVLTGASGGPTTYTKSLAGAVSPSGTLLKTVAKVLAGSVGSSGGLFVVGPDGIFLTGAITPVGTLVRKDEKVPSAVLGPTGSLSLVLNPAGAGNQTLRPGFLPIA